MEKNKGKHPKKSDKTSYTVIISFSLICSMWRFGTNQSSQEINCNKCPKKQQQHKHTHRMRGEPMQVWPSETANSTREEKVGLMTQCRWFCVLICALRWPCP